MALYYARCRTVGYVMITRWGARGREFESHRPDQKHLVEEVPSNSRQVQDTLNWSLLNIWSILRFSGFGVDFLAEASKPWMGLHPGLSYAHPAWAQYWTCRSSSLARGGATAECVSTTCRLSPAFLDRVCAVFVRRHRHCSSRRNSDTSARKRSAIEPTTHKIDLAGNCHLSASAVLCT